MIQNDTNETILPQEESNTIIINEHKYKSEILCKSRLFDTIFLDAESPIYETLNIAVPNVESHDVEYLIKYLHMRTKKKFSDKVIDEVSAWTYGIRSENGKRIKRMSIDRLLYLLDYFMLNEELIGFVNHFVIPCISESNNIEDKYKVVNRLKSAPYPANVNSLVKGSKTTRDWDKTITQLQKWKELSFKNANKLVDIGYDVYNIIQHVQSGILVKYKLDYDLFRSRLYSLNNSVKELLSINDIPFIVSGGSLLSCILSLNPNVKCEWPPHPSTDIDLFVWTNRDYNNLLYWYAERFDCKMFTRRNVTSIFIKDEPRCVQVINTEKVGKAIQDSMYLDYISTRYSNAIIIDDNLSYIEDIINSFPWDICKICYLSNRIIANNSLNSPLYAVPEFFKIEQSGWKYNVKFRMSLDRIERYRRKGVNIQIDDCNVIVGVEHYLNKYYTYTDITSEPVFNDIIDTNRKPHDVLQSKLNPNNHLRDISVDVDALEIIRTVYSKHYEITELPLSSFEGGWQENYDDEGNNNSDDN